MKIFETILAEINSKLTADQIQLLKDTIRYGAWGDTDMEFMEDGNVVTDSAFGYCTNDAKKGGHFSGRQVSAMFRSIYKKLGMVNGMSRYFTQCSDWWGDGSGDMFFIRIVWEGERSDKNRLDNEFEKWARS